MPKIFTVCCVCQKVLTPGVPRPDRSKISHGYCNICADDLRWEVAMLEYSKGTLTIDRAHQISGVL